MTKTCQAFPQHSLSLFDQSTEGATWKQLPSKNPLVCCAKSVAGPIVMEESCLLSDNVFFDVSRLPQDYWGVSRDSVSDWS
jgi:hypothetical protein